MSEDQYYEFRAIDRPLNDRQMRELRAVSTRAAISRTSFSNHYEYGDLKANPRDLLVKHFDASLYFANWLYLEVAFRYPKGAVDVKALRRYAGGHTLEIRSTARAVVVAVSVESDGDNFDTTDDGSSWLSSLAGLRADIAIGDERAPYLAWLLDVQCGVIADSAVEPAGLGNLSPALASFVDIFGLDQDLVAVAAAGDSNAPSDPSPRDIERWLAVSVPTNTSRGSHAWLVARGASVLKSCTGFDGMHGTAHPACRCVRSANCVPERRQSRRNGGKPLASVRLANVSDASEDGGQHGIDT